MGASKSLRNWWWAQLDIEARKDVSLLNKLIFTLIFVGLISQVLETEPSLQAQYAVLFNQVDWALTFCFTLEYFLRLWIAGEKPQYKGFKGRLRYMRTRWALIDLVAIAPMYLVFLPYNGLDNAMVLRVLRFLRLLKVLRINAFGRAIDMLFTAIASKGYELMATLALAAVLLLISATGIYFFEGGVQPEHFGSIPRALWWAVVTLTTVGYGDVFPMTTMGKVFAALTAIVGVGIVAMPAGILAAALNERVGEEKKKKRK
jgi:voltage-gated potassium channel